ncbi:glucosamine-6-phosphate deaminase [Arthrobacter sp. NQ7]|uniref:glucosamine-6-phosphate deaminase n=1 Tax=Arthrobacter sp. NQ7 TaxID=3032303 RepID=UPI00240F35E6|nr:glucosamine-6-phosphate deaminase [Arthrobacter sp. NQ7]MDJ0459304.1 glucosamine-6-phosphate deaminase [Arthrobacter sp. NQ7]
MDIIVTETLDELGTAAADLVLAQVRAKPSTVLGVATGSSPLPVYEHLARAEADFRGVTCFALDEYVGLPAEHEQSYAHFVRHKISAPLGIRPENTHVPRSEDGYGASACDHYEDLIRRAGGIDLQILGIGRNGHLAFNEPGSRFDSRTRIIQLTQDSRKANARFFPSIEDVPTHAITQGLGTIQEARHLLVVVSGEAKAAAVRRAVDGPVTKDMPASILQRHPNVSMVLDEAAASLLSRSHAL